MFAQSKKGSWWLRFQGAILLLIALIIVGTTAGSLGYWLTVARVTNYIVVADLAGASHTIECHETVTYPTVRFARVVRITGSYTDDQGVFHFGAVTGGPVTSTLSHTTLFSGAGILENPYERPRLDPNNGVAWACQRLPVPY